jgi:heme/copper-type cytochrome/quinol oxidase subunit 3
MNKNKIMMLFFVGSEAFFFIALIISYAYYSHQGGTVSPSAHYLDIKKTSVFTLCLICSSITMEIAGLRLQKGRRKSMLAFLVSTIVLGAVFLIGQGIEYVNLYEKNVTLSQNIFGSSFFTLTGFHGLHVLIGLIVLSIILLMLYTGKFKKIEATVFESATIYWHFVDAVWIVVFSVVYLWTIL